MIFYLTYNDAPSGIYSSQVIDVVKYLNSISEKKIKLVSLISMRGFLSNKKKIKTELSNAIVIPMFPGVHRWKLNSVFLQILTLFFRPEKIICRSVLATQLGLLLRKKGKIKAVVYDGRGAIAAEWNEYKVVQHPALLSTIFEMEKEAVLNSDYRIAVSQKLVEYWQTSFNYTSNNHVVIPCTLNKIYENVLLNDDVIKKSRSVFGIGENDVVFVYSGSVAGWQSFKILSDCIKPILAADTKHKLLFLSDKDENIIQLQTQFSNQVFCMRVGVSEVPIYLVMADYGLLLREETITNKVASPVKFAEYIACGLKVIISDNLGDYSALIHKNQNLGFLYSKVQNLNSIPLTDKIEIQRIGLSNFMKNSNKSTYEKLV
ncbi:MAG: hypothetical protein JSU07_11190 [Bacteroidetes bacterium]|nr:hypothetical protein [Bacteroidota bacterium]